LLFALWSLSCAAPYPNASRTSRAHPNEITTDSLVFQAATLVRNKPRAVIRAEITVVNSSAHTITLLISGGCPVAFQLLTGRPSLGREVWDSRRTISSRGCALSLLEVPILPGRSQLFGREVDKEEILGDSLRAGRYYVRAQLDLNHTVISVDAGEISLRN
jgi:hypothetical protein